MKELTHAGLPHISFWRTVVAYPVTVHPAALTPEVSSAAVQVSVVPAVAGLDRAKSVLEART